MRSDCPSYRPDASDSMISPASARRWILRHARAAAAICARLFVRCGFASCSRTIARRCLLGGFFTRSPETVALRVQPQDGGGARPCAQRARQTRRISGRGWRSLGCASAQRTRGRRRTAVHREREQSQRGCRRRGAGATWTPSVATSDTARARAVLTPQETPCPPAN